MRKGFKEKSLYIFIVVISCISIFALCERAEQIDTKKELPATQVIQFEK